MSTLKSFFRCIVPLLFLSSSHLMALEVSAVLDSLNGTAEVQREGSVKWVPIERDSRLYNNDVIRITSGSSGVVRWPDNSLAYAHGGTQILINIGPEYKKKVLSYATVFVGSVFFVIKKVLPRKLAEDIQIYTPTSVISIRGTSFAVTVAEKTGTSSIKMVSGTVRIRSITMNTGSFLSAPFQTSVEKTTKKITKAVMLTADIDSLKQWVPEPVIDFEISKHLAKSRRDRLILTQTMYEKCDIQPFENKSSYKGDWNISRIIPTILAQRISNATNRLTIMAPDSQFTSKQQTDQHTRKAPRFTITGIIKKFAISDHAEITVRADEYRERSIGRVSLYLLLNDSNNPDETDTIAVLGERSGKKNVENSWVTVKKYPMTFDDEPFSMSLIGSALDQAVETAAEKLIMKMYE